MGTGERNLMNHFKIEVPEGKTLTEGKITLNGTEIKGVKQVHIGAYPHMSLPEVRLVLRAECVEVAHALIQVEDDGV